MVPFAPPDFGDFFLAEMITLVIGAFVLAVIGFLVGMRLYRKGSKAGRALVVFSVLLPLLCYFAPSLIFRYEYGRFPLGSYPNGKIEKGMTPAEVEAVLGNPHRCIADPWTGDDSRWIYYIDLYGTKWFVVEFGDFHHFTVHVTKTWRTDQN